MARAQIVVRDVHDGDAGIAGLNNATVSLYAVNTSSSSAPADPTGTFTYTFSSGALTGGSFGSWATTPPTVPAGSFLWTIQATASSRMATDSVPASEFSTASVISATGVDGRNNAVVTLYRKSTSSTSAPSDPSGSFAYNFTTGVLSGGTFNSWSQNFPTLSPGEYAWAIQASASSQTNTDSIAASEFSNAVVSAGSGTNGSPGINTATVELFRVRTVLQGTPTDVSGTFTYTFATGVLSGGTFNSWSQTAPTVPAGSRLWRITAVASSAQATDTIPHGEFSAPVAIAGTGIDGNAGRANALVTLYHKNTSSSSAPSAFSGTATLTFSSGNISGLNLNGWSQTVPSLSQGEYLWQRSGYFSSTAATATLSASSFSSAVNTSYAAINGTTPVKGTDYNDAARSVSRTVYYNKTGSNHATVAPGSITISYNFNNNTFGSTLSNSAVDNAWTLNPPPAQSDGTETYWVGNISIIETITNGNRSGSGSSSINNIRHGFTFSGLVTFNSGLGSGNFANAVNAAANNAIANNNTVNTAVTNNNNTFANSNNLNTNDVNTAINNNSTVSTAVTNNNSNFANANNLNTNDVNTAINNNSTVSSALTNNNNSVATNNNLGNNVTINQNSVGGNITTLGNDNVTTAGNTNVTTKGNSGNLFGTSTTVSGAQINTGVVLGGDLTFNASNYEPNAGNGGFALGVSAAGTGSGRFVVGDHDEYMWWNGDRLIVRGDIINLSEAILGGVSSIFQLQTTSAIDFLTSQGLTPGLYLFIVVGAGGGTGTSIQRSNGVAKTTGGGAGALSIFTMEWDGNSANDMTLTLGASGLIDGGGGSANSNYGPNAGGAGGSTTVQIGNTTILSGGGGGSGSSTRTSGANVAGGNGGSFSVNNSGTGINFLLTSRTGGRGGNIGSGAGNSRQATGGGGVDFYGNGDTRGGDIGNNSGNALTAGGSPWGPGGDINSPKSDNNSVVRAGYALSNAANPLGTGGNSYTDPADVYTFVDGSNTGIILGEYGPGQTNVNTTSFSQSVISIAGGITAAGSSGNAANGNVNTGGNSAPPTRPNGGPSGALSGGSACGASGGGDANRNTSNPRSTTGGSAGFGGGASGAVFGSPSSGTTVTATPGAAGQAAVWWAKL